MQKTLLLVFLSICLGNILYSQQEEQYTQFMYYKLALNPGYAGNSDGLSLSFATRNQWLGLEGAPNTQILSVNSPVLNQRIGFGANIVRQSIGVTQNYTIDGAYAYRIKAPRGFIGLGIQTSVRLLRVNFSELQGTQDISLDQAVPDGIQSKFVPNFGAGIYYDTERFYIGFSAPRLLSTNIDLASGDGVIARETPHAYLMTGAVFPIGDNLQLQPQVLLKYVKGAPFDADVNVNLLIAEKFTGGLSYRIGGSTVSGIGEAISLLFGAQVSENIMFGISYDATVSELRKYNSGSIEAVVRYFVRGKSETEEVDNPRKFFD